MSFGLSDDRCGSFSLPEVRGSIAKAHRVHSCRYGEDYSQGSEIEKANNPYEPRAQQWSGVKQANNKLLSIYIDEEKTFNFTRFTYTPQGISELQLFAEESKTLSLEPREQVHVKVFFLMEWWCELFYQAKHKRRSGYLTHNA